MIDLKKHEWEEKEYWDFVSYVKGTWSDLFFHNGDFLEDVTIKKVIVSVENNEFDVFVYLNDNSYYDIIGHPVEGELVVVPYDGKPIKTSYTLNSVDILYIIVRGTFMEDLGLTDVEFQVFDYVDGIQYNEELSKRLEANEESWAEARYCAIHDL